MEVWILARGLYYFIVRLTLCKMKSLVPVFTAFEWEVLVFGSCIFFFLLAVAVVIVVVVPVVVFPLFPFMPPSVFLFSFLHFLLVSVVSTSNFTSCLFPPLWLPSPPWLSSPVVILILCPHLCPVPLISALYINSLVFHSVFVTVSGKCVDPPELFCCVSGLNSESALINGSQSH